MNDRFQDSNIRLSKAQGFPGEEFVAGMLIDMDCL